MIPRESVVNELRCDAVELIQRTMMLTADLPLSRLAGQALAAGLLAHHTPDGKAVARRDAQDAAHWRVYWRLGGTYRHKLFWGADPPVDSIVSLVCS